MWIRKVLGRFEKAANHLSSHPVIVLCVSLLFAAVALAGKTSVAAAGIVFFLIALIGTPILPRKTWARFCLSAAAYYISLLVVFILSRPDAITQDTGVLRPPRHTLLSSKSGMPYKTFIQIGDSEVFMEWPTRNSPDDPNNFFAFIKESPLTIATNAKGELDVSTELRDKFGKLVATIEHNEWKVAKPQTFDLNYSDSALEVIDLTGAVVLQVRLPKKQHEYRGELWNVVQLQGEWWGRSGRGIRATQAPPGIDSGAAAFKLLDLQHDETEPRIEPIFKYPSATHLGELR